MKDLNAILGQNAYWQVNKKLAKELGSNDGALLLSDLISKESYFNSTGGIDPDGWFYNTSLNIEEDTNISPHQQRKIIKALKERGFIETKLKGLPAKLHFKIMHNKLLNFLTTGSEKASQLDVKNFNTNKNKENKNKENKNKVINDEAEKNGLPVQTGDLFSESSTKKKSKVPAETSYKKLMDLYFDWYKKKNDGIPPKIDGAEGKALKSIAAYLEKIARDKFPEYKEEEIITEAEKFLSYIFSKWERLEPFYQKQIKLTQINSNISNIIHAFKNGHKTQSAGEAKRDRAGNISRAFDEIDAMFGPKQ